MELDDLCPHDFVAKQEDPGYGVSIWFCIDCGCMFKPSARFETPNKRITRKLVRKMKKDMRYL